MYLRMLVDQFFRDNGFSAVKITYPYQDVSTPLLNGEIWKDIPEFEGSFQVSNLGRVKSLDRTVSHCRCGTQFVN
jgi:hypothetical protein